MEQENLLPVGALVWRDGQRLRHVGGGRFVPDQPDQPAEAPLAKRFFTGHDGPISGGTCSS